MWISRSINIGESSRDVATDIAKGSLQTSAETIFSPNAIFPGQIHNHVRSDRSTKYSKIRRSSQSFIQRILYCQSGLSNGISNSVSASSRSRGINPRSLINHEFLLIAMKIRGKKHVFMAEKCGPGGNCGINIKPVTESEMRVFEEAQVSAFECEDTPMNLEQVVAILEDHDPNYAVQEKNCWEYAVHTTQRLLMACQRVTGKMHFGEQARLVGAKVTMNQVMDLTSRGIQMLFGG